MSTAPASQPAPAAPAAPDPAHAPTDPREWLVFGLLGLFWGTSYLFIKIAVDEGLPTFLLIAGRLGIGVLLLGLVVAARRPALPRDAGTYGSLLVASVLSIALPFTLITWGEQTIDSALAAILSDTVPHFTIVFAGLFLHDEPVTLNRLAGLVVGFAGVVVVTGGSVSAAGAGVPGELAMIASAFCYGAGNVWTRRRIRAVDPFVTSFLLVGFAFVEIALLALAFDPPWTATLTPRAAFAVAWLGIFGSGLAYLCFYHLLARWGSTRSSLVAYLLPVVGVAAGWLVLDERIDAGILAGTALIIGGVGLVNLRIGGRRLFGRAA